MMEIKAEKLSVRIDGVTILDRIDLTLRPGEMVGLIGPNGAGKSTLLRALAGLAPVEAGVVRYDGVTFGEIGRTRLAQRLSYLAQDGDAHWPLRVDRLVALGRLPHRRPFAGPGEHDRLAIERAMVAAEVEQFRARTVGSLSGGERMRVLLARALAVEADTLLADEPVAAVDPLHQLRIMQLLRTVARGGKCVVVVLHDLALATRFCDRLVLLAEGRKLLDGPPALLRDDLIQRAYRVTALRGEHDGEAFILPWAPIDDACWNTDN